MEKLSRKNFGYISIALAIVLFVAVNIAANIWLGAVRIDLTESGLYTVSDGTRATLAKLEEPITLRFFYSRQATTGYPTVNAYATRVRDLLQEYAALARGNVLLEEIDPRAFTPEEDQAVAFGLTGAPTQAGESVYFGLVGTNALDDREVIPFFDTDRDDYLEYDLTSLVYRLSTPVRPRLGILSALPLENGLGGMMAALQGNAQPFAIYTQLQDTFDVEMLEPTIDRIPDDISTLLVAHPAGFGAQAHYALDQFVLRGGHAIILVDPLSETAGAASGGMGGQTIEATSDLADLFAAWGVNYDPSKVVADAELAQRVRFGTQLNPETLDYLVWLRVTPDHFDDTDLIAAELQQVNLASAGALSPAEGASTNFAPLITSSTTAALFESSEVRLTQDPADLLRRFVPIGGPFTIAARISGPVQTAFPDGPPPSESPPADEPAANDTDAPESEPLPEQLLQADNINVVVMADSDFLEDRFWVSVQNILGQRIFIPTADNGALMINAVENMMGSNDLISLRTRAPVQRTFTVVEDLRRTAEARFLDEEQQLQQRVTETEAQLRALEGQGGIEDDGAARPEILSPEQQAAIENFRQELIETRGSLRAVQANLRRDVENLGMLLKFLNTALVPILVAFTAIGVGILRRRRRMQARGI